jgi:3-deoxy-D-manno-octulosonic-acid transferase
MVDRLRAANALVEVADETRLATEIAALLDDSTRRTALARAARGVAEAEAGVLDAVLREIAPWLDTAQRRHANGASTHHGAEFRARS